MNPKTDKMVKWVRSDALKRAQEEYYNKNKAKIVAEQLKYNYTYVRKKFTCECGDTLQIGGKFLHNRSTRHKDRMEMIGNGIDPNIKIKTFECECGSKLLTKNRNAHFQSKKHIDYLKKYKIDL